MTSVVNMHSKLTGIEIETSITIRTFNILTAFDRVSCQKVNKDIQNI